MKRFVIKISYDGTNFFGWQIQKQGRTVQQEIEKILSEIAKQEVKIIGSGRTDSGVHALGQYAHFDFPVQMNTQQIHSALNMKLPKDIIIKKVFIVEDDFHARYDARKRIYKYYLTRNVSPFNRFHKTFLPKTKLRENVIKSCLPFFMGEHDFTSFSKFNPDVPNHICEIKKFNLEVDGDDLIFTISATRFLHNMVRRIIGTILNISNSNLDPKIIDELFTAKTPEHKLIETAPAKGLYLFDVKYPIGLNEKITK